MRLAVFLSGRGSNFQAIADAIERGELSAQIVLVASNRSDAPGLETARLRGIHTACFDRSAFPDGKSFAEYMDSELISHSVNFIALAGYLRKIPPYIIRKYRNRIVNIHPALLPKYGGKGMYGLNVHRAVIESGDTVTGVTIHYVDEIYDNGDIIEQRTIPVKPDDTPESLGARVLKIEHQLYPEILQKLALELNSTKD